MTRKEFQVSDAAGWRTAKRRPAMPVETVIVVPEVWKAAKRFAAGDPCRIEVLSPEVVVVRNKRIRCSTTPTNPPVEWAPRGA
ncbi:hypothetical protein EV646_10993 [Kribbella antiqua]|uniref:Uncharacterized protein n=1 Tax=Kribbella antiqua TaxID=2512217 RepID=A0A4R2IIR1_9ACTN|nr:hypothetical protein [Kribbella antiqua]TCO44921.1 hypothetical protein EV646_10993 [Kribbella antiqua]